MREDYDKTYFGKILEDEDERFSKFREMNGISRSFCDSHGDNDKQMETNVDIPPPQIDKKIDKELDSKKSLLYRDWMHYKPEEEILQKHQY